MGRDGYTGLAVLAASLVLFWATLGLERHPMVPVGPAFYPRIVLAVCIVLALALVAADLVRRRRAGPGAAPDAATSRANYRLVAISFAVFTAYVAAMPYAGFRLSTLAFLVAMPAVLERPSARRRWIVIVVLAVVATTVSYYVFEHYLHVLLPRGRWTGF